jgi:hypothetical protein
VFKTSNDELEIDSADKDQSKQEFSDFGTENLSSNDNDKVHELKHLYAIGLTGAKGGISKKKK